MVIQEIGSVELIEGMFAIKLQKEFLPALTNISGFTHLDIVWWGSLFDSKETRDILITEKPYKNGPDTLGIFATRSPVRPNPILITTIFVAKIDFEQGIIYTPYIDAEPGTPVLDIKPIINPQESRIFQCLTGVNTGLNGMKTVQNLTGKMSLIFKRKGDKI